MRGFFANDSSSSELSIKINEVIQNAESYIKTGNFLFQDESIIQALIRALERGVAVFVLSNICEDDVEYNANMHKVNLKKLRKAGAHCRGLDDLHAKFIIGDGTDGIIMSANFSPNSVGQINIETGIKIEGEELKELEYTFDNLYVNADVQGLSDFSDRTLTLRRYSSIDEDTFSADRLKSNLKLTIASHSKSSGPQSNLRECKCRTLYSSILDIISRANLTLDIVTWHFKALDNLQEFVDAVKKAIARGVKIRLYSNLMGGASAGLRESRYAIEILEKLGCQNYGDDNNHSKCVISESEGIIFTANIDGKHGLKSGFEVGCILEGETLEQMRDYVNDLFKKVNHEYTTR